MMKFIASDLDAAKAKAQRALGDKAVIVSVRNLPSGDIEVTASDKPAPAAPEPAPSKSESKPAEPAPAPAAPAASKPAISKDGRVIASPLAKRLAAEKGVDLDSLTGSGPNGRIIKADVEAAQPGTAKPKSAAPSPANDAAPVGKPAAVEMADETRALLDERIPHSV